MRALIIDDATTVRMFHRDILERVGFRVDEARNGIEALEIVLGTEQYPDLLLVDVNMPWMDGYAFIEAVREAASVCDIPALMISTQHHEADAARAFAAGANLYCVKPLRPELLASLARALVGAEAGHPT